MTRIRIALVEDDRRTREILESLLRGDSGVEMVGIHGTGEEALERVPLEKPDVLLMDIRLPGIGGVEVVSRLCRAMPGLSVLMLTTYEDAQTIFEALRAGARGYLLKNRPVQELIEAIREVHAGGAPMSMRVARKVVAYFQEPRPALPEMESLSDREAQVLSGLAQGRPYKDIGAGLGISENTVRTYIRRIYEKLQVNSRTEAVAKFMGKRGAASGER